MAKVIVERPRHGSRMRGYGKGYQRKLQKIAREELPKREGMKRFRGSRVKFLNEHLSPLRRFLLGQVGRPWDKVFAEICAHISRDSAVQDHVRDHVFDYVADKVVAIDGILYQITSWGPQIPLFGSWRHPVLYVCPKSGILKLVKQVSRRDRYRQHMELPVLFVPIDFDTSLVRRFGVWHHVRFQRFPKAFLTSFHALPLTVFDVLQGTRLTRDQAVHHYGRAVVAIETRLATRAEIRKYAEPLKAPNRV